jgi:hypothetical protein
MLEIYECWIDDGSLCVIPQNHPQKKFLTQNQTHSYSIRASSWEEAMRAHHEIQGWEEYKSC